MTKDKITSAHTKPNLLTAAYEWLDKAVRYALEGKRQAIVELAFNQALALENAAFDGRQE